MNEQNDHNSRHSEFDNDMNANRKGRLRRSGSDDWNRGEGRSGADEFGSWNREGQRYQDRDQQEPDEHGGGYDHQERNPALRSGQRSGYQGGVNYGQGSTARPEGPHSQNSGGRWNGEQSNYGQHNYGVQRNYAQRQGDERQSGGSFGGYGEDRERFQSNSFRANPSRHDERMVHPGAAQASIEHRGSGHLYPPERPTQSSPASIYGRSDVGQASSFGAPPAHSFSGHGPKGYQRSDERVREEVCDALTDHHEIDASEIEVRVEGGEVTLSGSVSSRRAKRLAEDALEGVRGVRDISNQLRVRSEPTQRSEPSNAAMTAKDSAGAGLKKTENMLNS